MSNALANSFFKLRRRSHASEMKELSDAAAEVLRRHRAREIDAAETGKLLEELKFRHRTFLDMLVG